MTAASLELCKQLFELTGWDAEEHWASEWVTRGQVPAYDLGFLLRKLPKKVGRTHFTMRHIGKSKYVAGEWEVGYRGIHGHGDTPEDAACLLAIELFKQGVLKS